MYCLLLVFLLVSTALAGKVVGINSESSSNQTLSCPDRCNMNHGYCQPNGECSCYPGWEGPKCNQCSLSPGCMHGTCEEPFQCICKEGYSGRHCQLDMKYCARNQPCHNGGTCVNDGSGSFTCVCPRGYIGKTCGLRTTPPATTRMTPTSQPYCQNGGTCIFGNNIVGCERCTCPKGFAGDRCQSRVRMCTTRPCANGGRCFDLIDDFRCECTNGYTGRHCTEDVDECSILGQGACENGGTCVNKQGSYSCVCREGFEGVRCDKRSQRFIISRIPSSTSSSQFASNLTTSTSLPSDSISSVLERLTDRKRPSFHDVIPANKQSHTSIKVTKIIRHVEVKSSDVFVHKLMADGDRILPDKKDSDPEASVSVVQAVTFAFLGVSVALFISIAIFLWVYCKKRRKCASCWRTKSTENRFIEGEEDCEVTSSIVRREPPKYEDIRKKVYQPKPGLAVHTISPPRGQLVVKPRAQVDCLYVALPHNQVASELSPVASIDETNSLLECSKLNRSSNFFHHHR